MEKMTSKEIKEDLIMLINWIWKSTKHLVFSLALFFFFCLTIYLINK